MHLCDPQMQGEWGAIQARAGTPRVPKKEVFINPINPHGELAMLALPRAKIRCCDLNSHLFRIVFSGIGRV